MLQVTEIPAACPWASHEFQLGSHVFPDFESPHHQRIAALQSAVRSAIFKCWLVSIGRRSETPSEQISSQFIS